MKSTAGFYVAVGLILTVAACDPPNQFNPDDKFTCHCTCYEQSCAYTTIQGRCIDQQATGYAGMCAKSEAEASQRCPQVCEDSMSDNPEHPAGTRWDCDSRGTWVMHSQKDVCTDEVGSARTGLLSYDNDSATGFRGTVSRGPDGRNSRLLITYGGKTYASRAIGSVTFLGEACHNCTLTLSNLHLTGTSIDAGAATLTKIAVITARPADGIGHQEFANDAERRFAEWAQRALINPEEAIRRTGDWHAEFLTDTSPRFFFTGRMEYPTTTKPVNAVVANFSRFNVTWVDHDQKDQLILSADAVVDDISVSMELYINVQ